jgi:integrase/recombinase XerD
MKFLRQKAIDVLKLYNDSGMTIRTYVQAISDFAHYHGKSPELLGEEDIKTFLLYSQRRGLAATSDAKNFSGQGGAIAHFISE